MAWPRVLAVRGIPLLVAALLVGGPVPGAVHPVAAQAPNAPAARGGGQGAILAQDGAARELLGRMTLAEKVGQMVQPDQNFLKDPADISKYALGSVLSGGGSGPKDPARYNLTGWTDLIDGYRAEALRTRLAIPLLYGIDAVHGNNNIPSAVVFPHQVALGCTRNPQLVEQVARITAEEVRAIGVNWDFAPCVAVPQDIRWGRTYEGFSEDPDLAGTLGAAAVRGLQGASLTGNPRAVLGCAKHFAGDGGTSPGTGKEHNGQRGWDQGDTIVDEATLRRVHLAPYAPSIAAGVGTIMPSYSSWNGTKCSGSRRLLTEILKEEMGFAGFLISDYNAIDQLGPDLKEDTATAVNAGMDMIMCTDRYPELIGHLQALVAENRIPLSRIDDAVTRILRVKLAMGLAAGSKPGPADQALHATFGSASHRAVARQAVRESLVVLKNERGALPLRRGEGVLVTGRGADSLGIQCGGWTISWQGKADQAIPGGTTILQGLRQVAPTISITTPQTRPEYAQMVFKEVVVVGEDPYAEFQGDRTDLSLSEADRQAVAAAKKSGVPVVVVVLSGRPLILGDVLDQADAVVAAWLPGSEGAGVADVLFGDYAPTGRLARTWPKSIDQANRTITNGAREPGFQPAFPFGFGLSWEAPPRP